MYRTLSYLCPDLTALASLGNVCCANYPTIFAYLPAAPSTQSSNAMAWWLDKGTPARKLQAPLYPKEVLRMLFLPRSHRSGYLLRKDLHFQKENKSQHFSGGSSRQYQGGRRWHLAGPFMDYDLGYIDLEEKTLRPLTNLALKRKLCLRNVL